MRILVCIDDTDNLDSRGTGDLASEIAEMVQEKGWGASTYVTRHQLYVHPDIPYTSHNSAMCFAADVADHCLDEIIEHAGAYLARESAPGSDPGLCVAVVDRIRDAAQVLSFGRRAKETVLTIQEAYALAAQLGVHLSEHGGTGQGVIGALAGIGLRLGGNDGRLKGQVQVLTENGIATVGSLCAHSDIDSVQTMDGVVLDPAAQVRLTEKVKTVLLQGQSVLLVQPAAPGSGVPWQACSKQQLKRF